MKFILALLLSLLLTACAWDPVKPEPRVVVQQEYIVRIPPASAMTLPPEVPPIKDLENATQGDVARWIAGANERMGLFESKFKEIAKFLVDEQGKLDEEAKKKNDAE